MANWIGIDIGTSACKAVAIDGSGAVLRSVSESYPLRQVRPGWFEQDPDDWVRAAQKCLHALADLNPAGVGLAGQMHGLVALDAKGEVLRPAILWNDQRSASDCGALMAKTGPEFWHERTGNLPVPGLQIPKLMWMQREETILFGQIRQVLLPKDFVRFRLTGVYATEPSDASGVGCLNLFDSAWDPAVLDELGIPADWLPPVYGSSARTGEIAGVPVVGGAGDQAGAAMGIGVTSPGDAGLSLGSSGVIMQVRESFEGCRMGPVNNFLSATGNVLRLGVSLNCGTVLNAMAQGLGFVSVGEMDAAALTGTDSAPLFLPYLNGERCPLGAETMAHGFVMATDGIAKADVARSVFLGLTCNLALALREVSNGEATPKRMIATGGGTHSQYWCQTLADVFEVELVVPAADEGPALGAAYLAGLGLGEWPSFDTVSRPAMANARTYEPQSDRSSDLSAFKMELRKCIESRNWNVFTAPNFLP